jgi:hypothetical protein
MKSITLSRGFFALAFLTGVITGWIRHWPSNLSRGTQHILLIGLMFQAGFIGAAIEFLIRSFTKASVGERFIRINLG